MWVGVRRVVEGARYVTPSTVQKTPTDWKERKNCRRKERERKEWRVEERMRVIDDQV